jgi:hypothetical protein
MEPIYSFEAKSNPKFAGFENTPQEGKITGA